MADARRLEAEAETSTASAHGIGDDAAAVDEPKAEDLHGVGENAEEEEDDEDVDVDDDIEFVPAPLISLNEQLAKDKDDESLRRWKEKLLGYLEEEIDGRALCLDQVEPEVTFHSIGVISEGSAEIVTPLPLVQKESAVLFMLTEGSKYRLKLTFSVKHNIVSGLAYSNTVWKRGLQVDQIKGMVGTFAPQRVPYVHLLEEETTPSGLLARGTYNAKLKFEDDDKRTHLHLNYSFEIKKR